MADWPPTGCGRSRSSAVVCHATAVAGLVWPGPSPFHKNEVHPFYNQAVMTVAIRASRMATPSAGPKWPPCSNVRGAPGT